MPFIPTTEKNRKEMLKTIGVSSIEELLQCIPESIRVKGELQLPSPLSEMELRKVLQEMASQNETTETHVCFLGGGAYDHFIPAVIDYIISRSEFSTSYTPYQPEVAQGNLQAIYEYQTLICELMAMDASNASVYDGASSLAEAALLSSGHTGREEIFISKTVHPYYRKVVATYCARSGIQLKEIPIHSGVTDLEFLKNSIGEKTASVLIQHPNFLGILEPVEEMATLVHAVGGLFAVSVDPISLGILKPPGEYGADIATGEGQALGIPLAYGGPYLGLFAVKKALVRRLPGRLVAMTKDTQGKRGFVLTLQTREQHIRREKATSSICTNQQLCALAATIYLALMGKTGLRKVAELCVQKSHYLAERVTQIKGFQFLYPGPFFKEFAIQTPVPAKKIIQTLRKEHIFAGIDLSRFDYRISNALLIAVTEKRTREEMDRYVELLEKHFGD